MKKTEGKWMDKVEILTEKEGKLRGKEKKNEWNEGKNSEIGK